MNASRKYRIRHETLYEYAADVMHSHHLLHLVPRPAPFQECLDCVIEVTPEGGSCSTARAATRTPARRAP